MITRDAKITPEQLTPGRFETEILPMPANWYMPAICDLVSKNPATLQNILSDRNCTLLFFVWLSYGAFCTRKLPQSLQNLPDLLWKALNSHRWIELYTTGDLDNAFTKTFGMNMEISGHRLYITVSDYNTFSKSFGRYLHNMYASLNNENRTEFQQIMPISDASEMFARNYDSHFSLNEYIPTLNRLNHHLDISAIMFGLFSRISVSSSVREMLNDFKKHKDPSKFPILWERLAGHPDFGNLMMEMSRSIKTWFDVHNLTNTPRTTLFQNKK